jgi:hypothetical protein
MNWGSKINIPSLWKYRHPTAIYAKFANGGVESATIQVETAKIQAGFAYWVPGKVKIKT